MTRVYTNWSERLPELQRYADEGISLPAAAEAMGLSFESVKRAAYTYNIGFAVVRIWTPEEDAVLRANSRKTVREARAALYDELESNRSMKSIRSHAMRIGVPLKREKPGRTPAEKGEGGKKPPQQYKHRRCLVGGEMFDARIDEDGRLLEYSCSAHRNQANRRDGGMI